MREIGLLETIHKLVSQIINLRMSSTISFSEEVHGYRKKRGTYTAIGEVKLKMQMAGCESQTIYQLFLDLRKAYYSVNRGRTMRLLEKYGVGKNIRNYINHIWDHQKYLLRQAQFYSKSFEVFKGCMPGDTDSPVIFNVVIDAVIRAWKECEGFQQSDTCFYVDDGIIQHTDPTLLQRDLDSMLTIFKEMGLHPNATKTKFMVFRGAPAPKALSKVNYNKIRRSKTIRLGIVSRCDWGKKITTCRICG